MEEFISLKNRTSHMNANPDGEAILYIKDGVPYVKTATAINAVSNVATSGGSPPTPAVFTQTYSTADATLSAYTPDVESSAYVGADAAALLIELNALRVAYENLRAGHEDLRKFCNSIVDNLQALGLAG